MGYNVLSIFKKLLKAGGFFTPKIIDESTQQCHFLLQDDLVPATSVDEIVDVCGLMDEIPDPTNFLTEALASVP